MVLAVTKHRSVLNARKSAQGPSVPIVRAEQCHLRLGEEVVLMAGQTGFELHRQHAGHGVASGNDPAHMIQVCSVPRHISGMVIQEVYGVAHTHQVARATIMIT